MSTGKKKDPNFFWFPFDEVVNRLDSPHKSGLGYKAKCPAHDDRTPSFIVYSRCEGRGIWCRCSAGCDPDRIENALRARGVNQTERPKRDGKDAKIVATYTYTDAHGTALFEKVKKLDENGIKDFYVRHRSTNGSWKRGRGDAPSTLYRLHDLHAHPTRPVFLCEGEKDCNTLRDCHDEIADALGFEGFVATTNDTGSSSWRREYETLLAGRHVIILEDNDAAGRKRTTQAGQGLLVAGCRVELVRFTDMPEKSDVSDFLAAHGIERLFEKLREREPIVRAEEPAARPKSWEIATEDDSASEEDYFEFIRTRPIFGDMKREILSGELMTQVDNGFTKSWVKVANKVPYIRAEARNYGKFFNITSIEDRVLQLEAKSPRELLVTFPEWDGVDRIRIMADEFMFRNVSQETFYQLVCHWGATMFRRLENPGVQNTCLIIQGAQGAGKDSLVHALCGGLGDYLKDLPIDGSNAREVRRVLHDAICFHIPEFDRTAKTDSATLKDILTKPHTGERLSHDRRAEKRPVRASFIATANIDDLIVDRTGARRYWIFQADYLGIIVSTRETAGQKLHDLDANNRFTGKYLGAHWNEQPELHQAQILAQFKHLAATGFQHTEEARLEMEKFIWGMTPEDMTPEILQLWDKKIEGSGLPARRVLNNPVRHACFAPDQVVEIIDDIGRAFGLKPTKVRDILFRHGRKFRNSEGILYRAGIEQPTKEDGCDDIPF